MTKFKKVAAIAVALVIIGATSVTAFAVSAYNSPAEVVAALTGKTVEGVISERHETGNTYGAIADESGKLDEFKAEMLELKKDVLANKVKNGTMTQERADEIIAAMEQNVANCDGTGSGRVGLGMGAGFGGMNGRGHNGGAGFGRGFGSSCARQAK